MSCGVSLPGKDKKEEIEDGVARSKFFFTANQLFFGQVKVFSQQTNCFYFDDDQDPDDKRILQWEFSARGGSHLSRKSDFIPKQQSP